MQKMFNWYFQNTQHYWDFFEKIHEEMKEHNQFTPGLGWRGCTILWLPVIISDTFCVTHTSSCTQQRWCFIAFIANFFLEVLLEAEADFLFFYKIYVFLRRQSCQLSCLKLFFPCPWGCKCLDQVRCHYLFLKKQLLCCTWLSGNLNISVAGSFLLNFGVLVYMFVNRSGIPDIRVMRVIPCKLLVALKIRHNHNQKRFTVCFYL